MKEMSLTKEQKTLLWVFAGLALLTWVIFPLGVLRTFLFSIWVFFTSWILINKNIAEEIGMIFQTFRGDRHENLWNSFYGTINVFAGRKLEALTRPIVVIWNELFGVPSSKQQQEQEDWEQEYGAYDEEEFEEPEREETQSADEEEYFEQKEDITIADAYKELGLHKNASDELVRKAFNKFSQLYHPDNFIHESEETREHYRGEMQKINQAYYRLCPKGRQGHREKEEE